MPTAFSRKPDTIFLVIIIGLLTFGVVMVYDASVVYAHDVLGGKYHFLLKQLVWVLLGSLGAFVGYLFDLNKLRKLALPLFLVTLGMLFFLLLPRLFSFPLCDKFVPEVNGARRWIILNPQGVLPQLPLLGSLSFQPSEFAKLTLIIYLASWLAPEKRRLNQDASLPGLGLVLILLAFLGGLVLLEPDFATAVLLCGIGVWVYFVAGAPLLPLFAAGAVFVAFAGIFIWFSPYRRKRLLTFLDPGAANPLSTGYHLRQIMIALGSGGLFGLGLGKSRQKYEYLPETMGDSIFAIVGEEFGFLGTASLLFIFLLLIWRGFLIIRSAPDRFSRLLASGVVAWISLQILINLGAMVGVIPLTGMTLPFISYGGSSMIFSLAAVGLILNISSRRSRR
ncbi:MAG: FtsW/RodA/SpoVE family cell cycle protein [Patescibacteria group bacterium]